jgi:copper homeostasis protein
MKRVVIEIVCCTVADANATMQGGGDRIELCTALALGGLTPSVGLLKRVREVVGQNVPIMAMLRPRPGGFQYESDELAVLISDAHSLLEAGADGIVFGALNPDFTVYQSLVEGLVNIAGKRETVFHRAFDMTPHPTEALQTLIDCGVTRVLSSGQRKTALEGATLLRQLREQAQGRITILPGGGIRPHNVRAVLEQTGCSQVHLAPMQTVALPESPNPDVTFGTFDMIDADAVSAVRKAADQ